MWQHDQGKKISFLRKKLRYWCILKSTLVSKFYCHWWEMRLSSNQNNPPFFVCINALSICIPKQIKECHISHICQSYLKIKLSKNVLWKGSAIVVEYIHLFKQHFKLAGCIRLKNALLKIISVWLRSSSPWHFSFSW